MAGIPAPPQAIFRGSCSLAYRTNADLARSLRILQKLRIQIKVAADRMAMGHWAINDNVITIGFFPFSTCPSSLNWQINLPGTYSDHGIHFQAGEWHHWAMVWDNAGINGTSDLFRFYFDGALALVGDPGCPVRSTLPTASLYYFGRHVWDTVHADAVLDNLIIYDVAKTDFSSDRFQ